MLTDEVKLEEGKTIRRLELKELLEVLEGPVEEAGGGCGMCSLSGDEQAASCEMPHGLRQARGLGHGDRQQRPPGYIISWQVLV